jgi:hypothetical protein
MCLITKGFVQGETLLPLPFNISLVYAIRSVKVDQDGWQLNCTHQFLVYDDDVSVLEGTVLTIWEKAEALLVASK